MFVQIVTLFTICPRLDTQFYFGSINRLTVFFKFKLNNNANKLLLTRAPVHLYQVPLPSDKYKILVMRNLASYWGPSLRRTDFHQITIIHLQPS